MDGGDEPPAEAQGRYAAPQHARLRRVEARQQDLHRLAADVLQREGRVDLFEVEVPVALPRGRPAVAERSVGHGRGAGDGVEHDRLPLRRLHLFTQVVRREEAVRRIRALVLAQCHQERHVGVRSGVPREERHLAVDVELAEHHVAHGHPERPVHAGPHRQPVVGELDVLGVVGRDDHDLLAGVACLDHEVRVRRAGHGDVAAPDDQVRGVPPVGRFGDVGLVAEDLGRGRRQVRIPVVEGVLHAAGERHVPRAGRVRDGGHRRDGAHAGHPVRPPALDGVHVRRRGQLERLVPGGAHEAAVAARGDVGLALRRIVDDRRPCVHGVVVRPARLTPAPQQFAPHVGVAHTARLIGVPGEGGAPRTAARLLVGHVRRRLRVVCRLRLPSDEAVAHRDHPGAGPGAVHAVGGAHLAVVTPAFAVELLAGAVVLAHDHAAVVRLLATRVASRGEEQARGLARAPVAGCARDFALTIAHGAPPEPTRPSRHLLGAPSHHAPQPRSGQGRSLPASSSSPPAAAPRALSRDRRPVGRSCAAP